MAKEKLPASELRRLACQYATNDQESFLEAIGDTRRVSYISFLRWRTVMPITPELGQNLDTLRDVLERAANQLGKYPAALMATYTVTTAEEGHGDPLFALRLTQHDDTFVIMHCDIEADETAWRPVVMLPVTTRVLVAKLIPEYITFVATTATAALTDDTLQAAHDIEQSLAQLEK